MKWLSPYLTALATLAFLGLGGCGSHPTGPGTVASAPINLTLDSDGDGVPDYLDAFPFDPAASVDSDGDGSPDRWNANATPAMIAASKLHLDAFPFDPAASVDTDGDGFPDAWNPNATPAMIAASKLRLDAFPLDPAASLDTDGDGSPDCWNDNATPAMIAASPLHLDAFPFDPAASLDSDGDGFPDCWNPKATAAQIAASKLRLDAFPLDPAASLDSDGDGYPDSWNVNATPEQIAASKLKLDAFPFQKVAAVDTDGDGLPDFFLPGATPSEIAASGLILDAAPLLGITNIPTESVASPLDFGQGTAGPFEQQLLMFEEFGPEPMPVGAAAPWLNLPPPQNPQNGPAANLVEEFLKQNGVAPLPQRLANIGLANPWKPAIEAFLQRPLVAPPSGGVAGPAEGRPGGEDWAHQDWQDPVTGVPIFYPRTFYKTGLFQSRVNQGLRDSKQRHGYAVGEFAPGGLYHNVAGVSATDGTTKGIAIAFHPKLPVQAPNSVWTFDGTLPPKLLQVRYGEPILMRNYNGLPLDETANNGFGRHTITTHEHNGHNPAESDGYAGAFFFPGQFYDYRWPMQLAGFSNNNNDAGAINPAANEPRAAIPALAGETFTVLVNGQPQQRVCPDQDGHGNGTVMIPGDWRETMSTHWFHDHMLDHTAENVYKGNVSMMNYYSALDRGNEALNDGVNLRFPSGSALSWGNRDYDVNLVLADKAWDQTTGQLWYNTTQHFGFLGDRMTVNLLYKPTFDVRARRYRFRILNGSVSRIMAVGLVQEVEIPFGQPGAGELAGPAGSNRSYNRVPFHMIANDGNLLEHTVPFDGVMDLFHDGKPDAWKGQLPSQGIAERYDIVVDFARFTPGTRLYFVNVIDHVDGLGSNGRIPMADILSGAYNPIIGPAGKWVNGDPGVGKFLELRVQAYSGQDQSMNPAAYEPGKATMLPLTIDRHDPNLLLARHHTFQFVKAGSSQDGHGLPWGIRVDGGPPDLADTHRISTIEHGDLEVWRITTGGGWTHPVHIHFEEGVILTRGGKAPPEWETWARKDMYRIGTEKDSTQEVEIAYRSRDFLGSYVQHCHNTMHEDHSMLMHWNASKKGARQMDTPMPTWDGVFFEPSFQLPTADSGDGTGPVQVIPSRGPTLPPATLKALAP